MARLETLRRELEDTLAQIDALDHDDHKRISVQHGACGLWCKVASLRYRIALEEGDEKSVALAARQLRDQQQEFSRMADKMVADKLPELERQTEERAKQRGGLKALR